MTTIKLNNRPVENNFGTIVDSFFSELPAIFNNELNGGIRKAFVPVNVKELENSYQVEVIAPGFEKKDFKVNVDQNLLTVEAERKNESIQENEKQIRKEYNFSSFKRSFTIDEKIDATNIEASYINGVLTLNLPRKITVKATKEIEIK